MKEQEYRSFLVRLWLEDHGGELKTSWHSEIESIQTGQKWQVSDLETVIHFLNTEFNKHPHSSKQGKSG